MCCLQVKDDEPASSRLQGSEEVVTLSRDKTLLFHTAMPRRLTGEASPEVSSSAVLRADTLCRQVLFFMEITDPPKRARASRNAFAGPGMFGMPGQYFTSAAVLWVQPQAAVSMAINSEKSSVSTVQGAP